MTDAVGAIVQSIVVFILAFIGIAVLAALPSVEGTFAAEAAQFRLTTANLLVLAATTLGGVSLFIIATLGSIGR
ncbi:hypothetical protein [Halobacterium yunchengense]|uniref:hypothetical protein n=1 Tax=Halobacterium yunchengense TaxID=3108497 RepID=UPI0030084599